MEEAHPSSAPPSSSNERQEETSAVSSIKKYFLSFAVSIQEGFRYFKASLVGQVKKMTAKNEKEATEADLTAEKMQVEAADAAEDTKKRLQQSN